MENNDPSFCWFVILCHPNTEFLFTLSLLPFHLVSFTKILLAGFHDTSHILSVHVWDALDIFTPPLPNLKLMWRHVLFVSTWCMNFSPQPPLIKKRFIREMNKHNAACIFHPTFVTRLGVPHNVPPALSCSSANSARDLSIFIALSILSFYLEVNHSVGNILHRRPLITWDHRDQYIRFLFFESLRGNLGGSKDPNDCSYQKPCL